MTVLAVRLVETVAIIHVLMAFLEGSLWTWAKIYRLLGFDDVTGPKINAVAANVAIYNLFLAVGLLWALMSPGHGAETVQLFLGFIVLAGLFGGATLCSVPIAVFQALPAAAAFAEIRGGWIGDVLRMPWIRNLLSEEWIAALLRPAT